MRANHIPIGGGSVNQYGIDKDQEAVMRTRKLRRNHPKRHMSDTPVRMMTTQAGRWILLPGGGFGLRAPSSWDGKYPA